MREEARSLGYEFPYLVDASQQTAMAYRAACAAPEGFGGVIALGGDIPPELDSRSLARIPALLIGLIVGAL